eukprot:sb/3479677/
MCKRAPRHIIAQIVCSIVITAELNNTAHCVIIMIIHDGPGVPIFFSCLEFSSWGLVLLQEFYCLLQSWIGIFQIFYRSKHWEKYPYCSPYKIGIFPGRFPYSSPYNIGIFPGIFPYCSPYKIGIFPGIFPLKSLQFTVIKIIEIFSLKSLLQCCRDGKSLENSTAAVASALQQALQRWKIPGKFHCCSTAAVIVTISPLCKAMGKKESYVKAQLGHAQTYSICYTLLQHCSVCKYRKYLLPQQLLQSPNIFSFCCMNFILLQNFCIYHSFIFQRSGHWDAGDITKAASAGSERAVCNHFVAVCRSTQLYHQATPVGLQLHNCSGWGAGAATVLHFDLQQPPACPSAFPAELRTKKNLENNNTVCQGCRLTHKSRAHQIVSHAQGSKEVLVGELTNFVPAWDNNHLVTS